MKRIYFLFALVAAAVCASAANLSEDFSSLPAQDYSGTVTTSSGQWELINMKATTKNGSQVLLFNGNGSYVRSPKVDNPGTLTIAFGCGGSKEFNIAYSVNGGEWTTLDTYKMSSAGTYTYNKDTGLGETEGVRFKITATKGGNVWMTSITIGNASGGGSQGGGEGGEGGEGGDEPTNPDPQPEIPWTGPHSVEHCIYVAPWAPDDSGDGSWEHPYYNLQKAVDQAQPGDSIYVRGGTYYPSAWRDKMSDGKMLKTNKVLINKKGDADHWYTIKTFPGEFPVLNFKDQPKGTNKSSTYGGIQLEGEYWHIYGLHITEAGDNGIKLEGSHNRIERCTFSKNDDTGIQLGFGHKFEDSHPGISKNDGTYCAYNDVINCDSYLNFDQASGGGNADGFACKMHNGIGNRFIGCRAWHNSDDAWDLYETDFAVKMIECWGWASGDPNDFGGRRGNGNGIKLGGNGTGGSSVGIHEAWYCVAFKNNQTSSVKGFDENSHKGGVKLINCLAFDNGYDFMFEDCDDPNEFFFYNNVCMGKTETKGGYTDSNNAVNLSIADAKNAWKNNAVTTGFSKDDYVSLSEEDAMAPRAADGSLPTRFARLKSSSVLIGKGKDMTEELKASFPDLWQNYVDRCGKDLGPYDYKSSATTGAQLILTNSKELSLTVAHGNLQFTVPADGKACVDLFSPQGVQVAKVANLLVSAGGQYSIPVNAQLTTGVYVARLSFNGETRTVKFTVK
ncbi:MAG: hypothetical protein IJM78_08235 [Prevotella sp.]|nr:hypothetical protein [Prevotella sp.]